jgi:hypothetical protein
LSIIAAVNSDTSRSPVRVRSLPNRIAIEMRTVWPRVGLVNGVSNGQLVLRPNGSFNYTPNAGFVGVDADHPAATGLRAVGPYRAGSA